MNYTIKDESNITLTGDAFEEQLSHGSSIKSEERDKTKKTKKEIKQR